MKKIITCAALSVVLLTGCSFNQKTGVIKVNDTYITKAQFDKAVDKELDNSMFKAFGGSKNFVKSDDNVMYLVFKEKVAKELIVKTLLEQEIAKRGIKVTDEDIKNEMKSIIEKVGSREELNTLLKQRGISNGEFNEDLKSQIKIKKLVNSVKKITVSDADAQKYYNAHPEQFKHDEQVRASHILISANTLEMIQQIKAKNKNITPEDMNKKVEENIKQQSEKAKAVLKEVQANPDNFEAIAKRESDDKASAVRGGELGFFSKDAMVPEFSKAAFEMKPNTISELVQSPYGYHIIKVTDRVEAGTTPFAKVKDEIKFYLETQEQINVLKNLTDELMKSAKIEYFDDSINPEKAAKNINKTVKEENKEQK